MSSSVEAGQADGSLLLLGSRLTKYLTAALSAFRNPSFTAHWPFQIQLPLRLPVSQELKVFVRRD